MENEESPYCITCGSCGEIGCCDASKCLYAKMYYRQLLDRVSILEQENKDLEEKVAGLNLKLTLLEKATKIYE